MSDDVYRETVLVATGANPSTSPLVVDLPFDNYSIVQIDIRFPPGPAGEVGVAVFNSGTQILPKNAGTWIIDDNAHLTFTPDDYPTGTGWQIQMYNDGIYDHSTYWTFHYNYLVKQTPASTIIVPTPSQVNAMLGTGIAS